MSDRDFFPDIVNPPSLADPRGFNHGVLAPVGTRLLAVAGQIGWDGAGRLVGEDFPSQFAQALENVMEVVSAAGGEPAHVLELTIFVTDKDAYLADLRAVGERYRAIMGRSFPAMALVEVSALVEPGALVEIRALAAVPP